MWDKRYSTDDFAYGTEPNDFLRESMELLPVGDALCLGEGEGRNAVFLAEHGHRVTALDASAVGLEKAKRLAVEKNVTIGIAHADLADYKMEPNRWDGIVSIFCHLPTSLRKKVHRDIFQSLRPNGVFILEAYTPAQLKHGTGGPPNAAMMMSLAELRDELAGLELIVGREVTRDVNEGAFHNGSGATVQIIARKS
ncbi:MULTISPECIES: class I SAM-dependent methyltransferase [Sphingomonadales]|uniref:Methyltransferase domain-containing protein n=1 Tax=Sphingobium ummariense RL-3 TaxID=1346791 RepID=T0IYN8_9SPHN|nr:MULTISPECIES: class I SAM-dependent methyltransferase [Sphingomonadaceae]EQB33925.1 hypothetical protein M529_02620 [Sphingobium ummariense RL-3]WOF45903.1 class I SAM-dependent methyltransferase [Sphingopyxis indica]